MSIARNYPYRCRSTPLLRLMLLFVAFLPAGAWADGPVRREHVTAELIAATTGIVPGEVLQVGLVLDMDEHWHTYWINPGDAGMPTRLTWDLPDGFEAGEIQWPRPEYFEAGGLAGFGYNTRVVLPVQIKVPADVTASIVTLRTTASWLVCEEVCIPGKAELTLTLPVTAQAVRHETHGPLLERWQALTPQPAGAGQAAAYRRDGKTVLAVRGLGEVADSAAQGARFFPLEGLKLEPAAPQPVTWSEGELHLELTHSELLEEPLTKLVGVLVVERGEIPPAVLAIDLPVQDTLAWAAGEPSAASGGMQLESGQALWLVLLSALAGGMLLNLMPCVFPVLSIKVLSFVQQAGDHPARVRRHGLMFALGVLVSFWALVAVLLVLRAGGEKLGWGFQLQQPVIVAGLALLLFAVGLNLAGVFDIGFGLMRVAGEAEAKAQSAHAGRLSGSFFSGVLATLVATPCTGPLMGPAIGYALGLSAGIALLVFTCLGLGMALPYVILTWFPQWLKWLPRPGAWMETFKQIMAFPMFAAAIWLVTVYVSQRGADALMLILGAALVLAIGLWWLGRFGTPHRSAVSRWAARTALVACAALALYLPTLGHGGGLRDQAPDQFVEGWIAYDGARITEFQQQGRPVFVDFTADWCLTCKWNEKTVLASDTVRNAVAAGDVVMMKADWTSQDERITAALASFGRSSVPLYVVYPAGGGEPVVLPTVITAGMVVDALERAAAPALAQAAAPHADP